MHLFRTLGRARCSFLRAWLCGIVLARASSAAEGDPPPLVTDRPGNGNAARTVPSSRLQIETSSNYAYEGGGARDIHLLSLPTVLRYGLLRPLELRAGTSIVGIELTDATGADTVVPTDTLVGTKLQLLDNAGAVPDLALGADVFVPTGDGLFTGDTVGVEARGLSAWSLPAGFGLLLNAGADVPEDAGGRYARFLYVVNASYSPAGLDGRLTVFVESFGTVAPSEGRDSVVQLDWGAALLVAPLWQIDAFLQHGLSDAATDLQAALGVSTLL